MRLVPVTALAAALLLTACGSTTGPGAASTATTPSPVLAVPPADGPVTGVDTVLQPRTLSLVSRTLLGARGHDWLTKKFGPLQVS